MPAFRREKERKEKQIKPPIAFISMTKKQLKNKIYMLLI
jgi:hypothetical protein